VIALRRLRFASLIFALALGGCSSKVTELEGAMGTIPIFNPASFKERTSSFTSDNIGDPMKFSTYTWYLETEESAEAIAAFYAAQWPGAERIDDDGEITIRNPPFPENEDEPLGESVLVSISTEREGGKTQFYISEDVFRARRR